ncbi:sensor histidine kinase, partial [candidate division FCPU426 bacterium]|nr:sensor histidine kinase [candidate division FCPU426 bacterium]
EVVFSVADQGDPLSSQQQQKVFEKFYRATSKPGAAPAGSGLGLAICRITVENHGGQLWVESGPEGGNAFRFRLKRVSGPAAPPL